MEAGRDPLKFNASFNSHEITMRKKRFARQCLTSKIISTLIHFHIHFWKTALFFLCYSYTQIRCSVLGAVLIATLHLRWNRFEMVVKGDSFDLHKKQIWDNAMQ